MTSLATAPAVDRGPGGVIRRFPTRAKRGGEMRPNGFRATPNKRFRRPSSPSSAYPTNRPATRDDMRERRERVVRLAQTLRIPRSLSNPGSDSSTPQPYERGFLPSLPSSTTPSDGSKKSSPSPSANSTEPLPDVSIVNSAVRRRSPGSVGATATAEGALTPDGDLAKKGRGRRGRGRVRKASPRVPVLLDAGVPVPGRSGNILDTTATSKIPSFSSDEGAVAFIFEDLGENQRAELNTSTPTGANSAQRAGKTDLIVANGVESLVGGCKEQQFHANSVEGGGKESQPEGDVNNANFDSVSSVHGQIDPSADPQTQTAEEVMTSARLEGQNQDNVIVLSEENSKVYEDEGPTEGVIPALDDVTSSTEQDALTEKNIVSIGQEDLTEKDGTVSTGQKDLAEKNGIVLTGQEYRAEKDGTVSTGQEDLAEKDGTVSTGQEDLAEKDGTVSTGQEALAEKDETGSTGQKDLAEKDGTVSTGQEDLAEKDGTVSTGQEAVDDKDETTSTEQGTPAWEDLKTSTEQEAPLDEGVTTSTEQKAPVVEGITTSNEQEALLVEGVTTSTEQDAPVVEGITTSNEQEALLVEGATTSTEQKAPAVEGVTTSTEQDAPVVEDVTTSTEQDAPVVEGITSNEQEAPLVEGATTSTEQKAPVVEGVTTSTEQKAPVVEGVTTSTEQDAPVVEGVTTSTEQDAPVVEGVTTSTEQDAPVVVGVTTSTEQDAPVVEGVTTSTEQDAPVVEGVTTSTEQDAPVVVGVTTSTEQDAPVVVGVTTSTEQDAPVVEGVTTSTVQEPHTEQIVTVSTIPVTLVVDKEHSLTDAEASTGLDIQARDGVMESSEPCNQYVNDVMSPSQFDIQDKNLTENETPFTDGATMLSYNVEDVPHVNMSEQNDETNTSYSNNRGITDEVQINRSEGGELLYPPLGELTAMDNQYTESSASGTVQNSSSAEVTNVHEPEGINPEIFTGLENGTENPPMHTTDINNEMTTRAMDNTTIIERETLNNAPHYNENVNDKQEHSTEQETIPSTSSQTGFQTPANSAGGRREKMPEGIVCSNYDEVTLVLSRLVNYDEVTLVLSRLMNYDEVTLVLSRLVNYDEVTLVLSRLVNYDEVTLVLSRLVNYDEVTLVLSRLVNYDEVTLVLSRLMNYDEVTLVLSRLVNYDEGEPSDASSTDILADDAGQNSNEHTTSPSGGDAAGDVVVENKEIEQPGTSTEDQSASESLKSAHSLSRSEGVNPADDTADSQEAADRADAGVVPDVNIEEQQTLQDGSADPENETATVASDDVTILASEANEANDGTDEPAPADELAPADEPAPADESATNGATAESNAQAEDLSTTQDEPSEVNPTEASNENQEQQADYDILIINPDGECSDNNAEENDGDQDGEETSHDHVEDNPDVEDKGMQSEGGETTGQEEGAAADGSSAAAAATEETPTEEVLAPYEEMVQVIRSGGEEEQYATVKRTRKLLSKNDGTPIDEFLKVGILPPLKACLEKHHNPQLQFETLWALTNIASGTSEQTKAVVDADFVPIFLRLLSSNSSKVREQAVWVVGNILGDSPELRDRVVEEQAIPRLYDLYLRDSKEKSLENLCWTFTNIFRHKPWQLEDGELAMCRKAITGFFYGDNKRDVQDALWTMAFMTDAGADHVNWVVDSGFVPRLEDVLQSGDPNHIKPALHVITNLLRDPNHRKSVALRSNVVLSVVRLSTSSLTAIRKDAAKALDIIVNSGDQELLNAALEADLPTGLALMMQRNDPLVKGVVGAAAVAVARDTAIEKLPAVAADKPYIMALNLLLHQESEALIMNGLEALLTAIQRCSEIGYSINSLERLLATERMLELARHDDSSIKTLSRAAVSYYSDKRASKEAPQQQEQLAQASE
ncbi:Armadillo [Trinorchestia longiramus]|nr:Armadillo [Trinorchestia longiramus]